jgi:hypothetical protein
MVTAILEMVTPTAMAMATIVVAVATKTTAMTVVGGTVNNQLKMAAEETTAVVTEMATETVTATKMATVTAITTPTPTIVHQRQQGGQHAWDMPCG